MKITKTKILWIISIYPLFLSSVWGVFPCAISYKPGFANIRPSSRIRPQKYFSAARGRKIFGTNIFLKFGHLFLAPDYVSLHTRPDGGCPRGVMVKAMDCGIVLREFVLQSRYYVHFRPNTFEKGMNPLIFPAMG